MVIACIISFMVGAMRMMFALGIVSMCKDKEPRNKVRFFMTSDSIRHPGWIKLWMGEPVWDNRLLLWIQPNNHVFFLIDSHFQEYYNIDPKDFEDMKPKEIREVFINLED